MYKPIAETKARKQRASWYGRGQYTTVGLRKNPKPKTIKWKDKQKHLNKGEIDVNRKRT